MHPTSKATSWPAVVDGAKPEFSLLVGVTCVCEENLDFAHTGAVRYLIL